MGSESDCLFGQFDRILWISDSDAGVKVEKTGGVTEGEGRCENVVVGLLARDRRSLDILSVKKKAKLSASEIPGAEEGKGEEDWCIVAKRLDGSSQDETWHAGKPRPWPYCVSFSPSSPAPKLAHPLIFGPYLL